MGIDTASWKWDDETKYNRDKRTINNNIKAMERQLQVIEEDQLKQTISDQLQELKISIQNDNSESNKQDIKEKRDEFRTVANARKILENISPSEINSSNELCTFAVQTLLRTKGYFNDLQQGDIIAKDRVDAINGIETKKAINNFQTQHNLTPTWKIDAATIQKLLEETIDHGQYFDDPEKRDQVNTYINELQSYTFDQVVYATDNTYKNKLFAIKNYNRTKLQKYEKSNAQHASLIDNINRIDDYIDIGDKYSQIVNKIKEADRKYWFDQNWNTLKTTIEPWKMKDYRDEINAINNIDINSCSTLQKNDQQNLQTLISKINTQLHQKENEYKAYRAEKIDEDPLIEKLLKDADVINKAITNYNDEEIKKEEYHFKKGEYRKGTQTLADILRSNKRPKIKRGKEEYIYKTSWNDLQTLKDSSQQYKAIVNAIEQWQSKDDIKNNLNTLLYQEIAEEPEETSSVTPTATEQTPGTEINEGEKVISEKEFETLCHQEKINKKERDKIIKYANQNKLDELELWCENIPPFNLLDKKDTSITMYNKKCELNRNNIDNIKEMTFFLDFRHLNITTDISSLQCSYLQVGYLSTNDRNYLKWFQWDLMIDRSHWTVNSDLSEFKCPSLYLWWKLSNDERKYVKWFKNRLDIEIDNFDSLPDLSEVQCSSLNLNVPEHFNIDTISEDALQNLLKYKKKLKILEDKDDGDDYIDITEKVKKRMEVIQTH